VETEAYGDSKSTNERDSSLVGLVCWALNVGTRAFPLPWLL
jgi:hypothetical protein